MSISLTGWSLPRCWGQPILSAVVATVAACVISGSAAAQAPGLPVLQDAYFSRGFAAAVNAGGGGGMSAAAAALSWAPGARLALAGGAGVVRAGGTSQATLGLRLAFRALTFGATQQFAVAAFVGAGAARTDSVSVQKGPFGAAASFRHSLGATRAVALFVTPYYDVTRATRTGLAATRTGKFRGSIGADVSLTPSLGVTLGVDAGGAADEASPLDARTLSGLGLSYRF